MARLNDTPTTGRLRRRVPLAPAPLPAAGEASGERTRERLESRMAGLERHVQALLATTQGRAMNEAEQRRWRHLHSDIDTVREELRTFYGWYL